MTEALDNSLEGQSGLFAGRLALHVAQSFGGAVSLFHRPLSAPDLIRVARKRTGLTDFGEWEIAKPLAVLVESYENEANLNGFGRIAARWDALRFLSNLLRLREKERRDPTILDETIEAPIFIAGMPRSGTSFLQELLAEDTANRAVRCWETIYPLPLSRADQADAQHRQKRVDRQLATFTRMSPEIRSLHPMDAFSPQECTEITGHVFQSMRFDTTHYVPTYRRWLDTRDQTEPYRFHKRFLQHLQHRRGRRRWVLKCPDHVFALNALRAVYPDARVVFMHRDPLAVLPSLARLTEALRRPFTDCLDRREIGVDLARQWSRAAAILMHTAANGTDWHEPPLHLLFSDFVRDPVAAAERVYRHFGISLEGHGAARIRALAARKPRGGNGRNYGRLDDYGFDPRELTRRFADYRSHFGFDD